LDEAMIDLDNPTVKFCIAGTRAEFEERLDDAHSLYQQAWDAAQDDYEACIAAHYLARFQTMPADIFEWNQEALRRGEAVADGRAQAFLPSLYLNMGYACEQIGDVKEAQRYYDLAAALGYTHHDGAAAQARYEQQVRPVSGDVSTRNPERTRSGSTA
jgi:tetratricopeptide (TPR) repeat protein